MKIWLSPILITIFGALGNQKLGKVNAVIEAYPVMVEKQAQLRKEVDNLSQTVQQHDRAIASQMKIQPVVTRTFFLKPEEIQIKTN